MPDIQIPLLFLKQNTVLNFSKFYLTVSKLPGFQTLTMPPQLLSYTAL
jgi:hypothetical protein